MLGRAIADGWSELYLEVDCTSDLGELQRMEVFANGVGIWNRTRQFQLSEDQLRAILVTLRDGGFARLAGYYGKGGASSEVPDRQSPAIGCRILLRLDGVAHGSAQRSVGFQSQRLRTLALRTLAPYREIGEAGTAAENLADGLAKVADGRLAPETMKLVVHRKPRSGTTGDATGWLLRIERAEISTRGWTTRSGYGAVVRLDDRSTIPTTAGLLAAAQVDTLPLNLWSDHYTDLSVAVLQHRRSIQARAFKGLEPTTLGANQERFERLFGALRQLHRRVLSEGVVLNADD